MHCNLASFGCTGRLNYSKGKIFLPMPEIKEHHYSRVVNYLSCILLLGSVAVAQNLTEDEETVEDSIIEDEDDEAEVEEDEPTDLVSVTYDLRYVYNVSRIYSFYRKICC